MKFFLIMLLLATHVHAVQYYVRTDGADTNDGLANAADAAGTAGQAWLTIQKAATTMVAGDTVTVQAGTYPEKVTTAANGSLGNRIIFQASGAVILYGWQINHGYITVNGFNVRYASSAVGSDGFLAFGGNGDNCIVENCTFGPGIGIKRTDFVFADTNPDTITSATGGFNASGIRNGATINVWASVSAGDTLNRYDRYTVASFTDTVITLSGGDSVTAESGATAFLYGIEATMFFNSTSNDNIIRNNTFATTNADWMLMSGTGHIIENNVFDNVNGFDGIAFAGTNITIRRNLIKNSSSYNAFNPSTDALTNNGSVVNNITIEENMIVDYVGNIDYAHATPQSGPVIIRKNVFVNTGAGFYTHLPNPTFDRNTFYDVAKINNAQAPPQNHAIVFFDSGNNVTSAIVTSNLFIGCGLNQTSTNGWYINSEPALTSFTANYNYVTGPSPGFATKTGFSETNGINGGNPLFVNAANPIGPDGIAFTADDGLRLAAGSPAIGAGPAGADLGAYDYVAAPPSGGTINATITNAGTVTVQ